VYIVTTRQKMFYTVKPIKTNLPLVASIQLYDYTKIITSFYLPSIVSGYCRRTSGSTTNRVSSTTKVNLSVIRKLAAILLLTTPPAAADTIQHQYSPSNWHH